MVVELQQRNCPVGRPWNGEAPGSKKKKKKKQKHAENLEECNGAGVRTEQNGPSNLLYDDKRPFV